MKARLTCQSLLALSIAALLPAGSALAATTSGGTVNFSGKVVTSACAISAGSANIDVDCECRDGLCGSCEVQGIEGDIDHRDMVLTRAERAACTKMMSCCSRAKNAEQKIVLAL